MGNGHMRLPPPNRSDRQTPVKILPSHNFVGGVVIIPSKSHPRNLDVWETMEFDDDKILVEVHVLDCLPAE